jgi:hypothetical protein
MQTSRYHKIFILVGVISLLTSYLAVWNRFINDPVQRTGSDFIAFYSAGRVAQKEGFSKVYDPLLQQAVQSQQVGFPLAEGQVLLYNHIPFLIPILRLLTDSHYVASFYRWIFLLIILYVLALILLSKVLKHYDIDKQVIWVTGIGSFLFLPLFFSLMNGQDTAFLLLGVAIWFYGLISGKETLAGLGLSLSVVRPHISLLLAIPMLFSYRRVFFAYIISAGSLALMSVLIVNLEGSRAFVNILLISAAGQWHGMKEEAMYNLIGILTRALPGFEATNIRTLGWAVYFLAVLGLILLWARKKDLIASLIGTTIIIAIFTVPHLHFHDLTLLLVPLYVIVTLDKIKKTTAMLMPIAVSLLLLISNSSYYLQYTVPYLIMLGLVYYTTENLRRESDVAELRRS